jgi:hypothetical protein
MNKVKPDPASEFSVRKPGDEYAPYTSRLDNPFLDDMYIESSNYDYRGEPGYLASQSGRDPRSIERGEGVLRRIGRFLGLGPKGHHLV